jgi:sulfur carrier protein
MTVVVNGAERDVRAGTSVATLVEQVAAEPTGAGIAVAVNGEVIPRGSWEERTLEDGDAVEVVAAVQGGAE